MSNQEKNIGRKVVPKIIGKKPAHEVVNITLAEYLKLPKIDRTGLYLIGLAMHNEAMELAFYSEEIDWALVNFRTGKVIMKGSKCQRLSEKDIEKIQLAVCDICFLYDRENWLWPRRGKKPLLDA